MTTDIKKDVFQTYNQNHILSECKDILLEAKRVILNEQLDKITNITLSQIHNTREDIENCIQQGKQSSKWENENFWKDLPHPKKLNEERNFGLHNKSVLEPPLEVVINDLMRISTHEIFKMKNKRINFLTRKYFSIWQEIVNKRKEKTKLLENGIEQTEKLEKFIKQLKKYKKQEQVKCSKTDTDCIETQTQNMPTSNYKNRFNAQKNIIESQKAKLEEQNKIIEELKLGIIREDIFKSIQDTKINIQEIFSDCSERLKCKMPVIIIEEKQKFMLNSKKAPKVIQKMEQRALQRAQNRQIILERKRLIEEEKQRQLEEALENKRVIEEEERQRNLQLIKEKRKKDLELEKIRQANKQRYLENLNKAIRLHERLLIERSFKKLYCNFRRSKNNVIFARNYYKRKVLKKRFFIWCDYIEEKYRPKYEIADAHFEYKVLKKSVKVWHDFYIEGVRNMQVAEDLYDFRLMSNTFIHLHRYVCTQIMIEYKRNKIAKIHYFRKILFHYFYQWRSLPAVVQLEKAKEMKKQKWREKVWEILPDYRPPEDI